MINTIVKKNTSAKKLGFNEIMNLYEELYPGYKFIRIDEFSLAATPGTFSARLRESIKLSELFIKKKKSKK